MSYIQYIGVVTENFSISALPFYLFDFVVRDGDSGEVRHATMDDVRNENTIGQVATHSEEQISASTYKKFSVVWDLPPKD